MPENGSCLEMSLSSKIDSQDQKRMVYFYGLFKRSGWKNRIVTSRKYVGGGFNRHSFSIDINSGALFERQKPSCEDGKSLAGCIPLYSIPKQNPISNLHVSDGSGHAVKILPRIEANVISKEMLFGCLIQYEEMRRLHDTCDDQTKAKVDLEYSNLYPCESILLPSDRMTQVIDVFIEGDAVYNDADCLIHDMEDAFRDNNAFSEEEEAIWKAIIGIYEFKRLLLMLVNERLLIAVVRDQIEKAGGLFYVQYDVPYNIGYVASGADDSLLPFTGALLSLVIGEAFSFYLFSGFLPFWLLLVLGVCFAVPNYFIFAEELMVGVSRFFGMPFLFPLREIGYAEKEHFTFEAPQGTVFSPVKTYRGFRLFRNTGKKRERAKILDRCPSPIRSHGEEITQEEAQANIVYAMTPTTISVKTNKCWNDCDPWAAIQQDNEERGIGRRRRWLPYCEAEDHNYGVETILRPRMGKRCIGYALAPLIALASIIIMFLDNDPTSSIAALASLIPMLALALTVAEEETFSRRILMGFVRAGWKLSIILAGIAIVLYFAHFYDYLDNMIWQGFVSVSVLVLTPYGISSLIWLFYHLVCDRWTRKSDAFQMKQARLFVD